MSHTIYVPIATPPQLSNLLKAVPRAVITPLPSLSRSLEQECLVAVPGSARGVALSLASNEDGEFAVGVRLFTCSSTEDLTLAFDLVAVLMSLGKNGALNEDGHSFSSLKEFQEHYDSDFITRYVAWGPEATLEGAEDVDDGQVVQMAGPWALISFCVEDMRSWHNKGVLSESMLGAMVGAQQAGEQAWDAIARRDSQALRVYLATPQAAAAFWRAIEVLTNDELAAWSDEVREKVFQSLCGLHQLAGPSLSAGATSQLLMAAGLNQSDSAESQELTKAIVEAGIRHAKANFVFAQELANSALDLAKSQDFSRALSLFDFIIQLPRLEKKTIEVGRLLTPQGKVSASASNESRSAQASWACNALWAVSADNNHLPLQPERARRYLAACLPYAPENPSIYFNAACLAFELGDYDQVFAHIRSAVREGYDGLDAMRNEPLFAPLCKDPRFAKAFCG